MSDLSGLVTVNLDTSGLQAQIESLTSAVNAAAIGLQAIRDQIAALPPPTDTTAIIANVTALAAQVDGLKAAFLALPAQQAAPDLTGLTARVTALEQYNAADHAAAIADLTARLASLESRPFLTAR